MKCGSKRHGVVPNSVSRELNRMSCSETIVAVLP